MSGRRDAAQAGYFEPASERVDTQVGCDRPATSRGRRPDRRAELPSVALTTKFLELCQQCGSEQLAVRIVAAGRSTGLPGLPQGNDWTAWNADEMRAAVEHLQHKLGQ